MIKRWDVVIIGGELVRGVFAPFYSELAKLIEKKEDNCRKTFRRKAKNLSC